MQELLREVADYIQKGGWIMAPLGLCSIVLWTLILERLVYYRELERRDLDLPAAIEAVRGASVPPEAHGLCAGLVKSFLGERSFNRNLDQDLLESRARELRPELDRSLALIGVLAAVAPLLGLLGTVIGMVRTFDVISTYGTGNARAMADGISIALVTTQTGLVVAVPGLLFSHLLQRRSRRLETKLREITVALMRHL